MRVFLFCLFFCLDFFLGGGVKDLGYGCLLPTLSKTMLHTGSTGYHPQNWQLRQQDNVRSSTHLYGWAQKVGHSSNSFWFRKSSPALMFLFKYPFLSSPHQLIGPSHPAFVCWQEIWVWKPKSTWDSIEVLLDSRSCKYIVRKRQWLLLKLFILAYRLTFQLPTF